MAGTVRKRTWTTRQGETKTAWTADYFDQNRQRHTKQFATKKAADAWLLRVRTEVRDGIHVYDKTSITVAEAGELWLERGRTEGLERGTLAAYEGKLRCRILPGLGSRRLGSLTAPIIEAWRDDLLKDVSRLRARDVVKNLKAIIANAQRLGLIVHNPALAVKVDVKARQEELLEVGRDIPSADEIRAILDAVAEWRWHPLLVTAAYTGMRASELRGLHWDAVDLKAGVVRVRQRADHWKTLGAPKSAAARRDIPLAQPVLQALRASRLRTNPFDPKAPVFANAGGGIVDHSTLRWIFNEAQQRAGIVSAIGRPKYRFHALRHFFASAGIAAGFAPKRLQGLLGHASITMTYDVYGHLFKNPEDDLERLALIERMVSGKKS